jgi:hypothetical protein
MRDGGTFSVDIVESESLIPADLWAACFPAPLEGHWWYQVLEQSGLEEQFTFLYAVPSIDGVAVGIAPLFIMKIGVEFLVPKPLIPLLALIGKIFKSLSEPRVLLVGSPCSDEGMVGLLPGVDRAAALFAVQQAIEREAERRNVSMTIWKDFPQSDDAALASVAERAGLFRMVSFPGTALEVPSGRKEDYFAAMRSSRRYNLRRKLKRSAERFDAVVEVVERPDAALLDRIYALFERTRNKSDMSLERLGRQFFERVAREPAAHFILLRERASDDLVAFKLCFEIGTHVINKYIGIDYGRPKDWFLFFRLSDVALDWALARGARTFQSGQTGYGAKLEQGHRLVPLTVYGKHRNPMMHRICRMVTERIRWETLDDDLAVYVRAHPQPR